MKKISIVAGVLLLLLAVAGASAYLFIMVRRNIIHEGFGRDTSGLSDEMRPGIYSFDLKESPWVSHVDTTINTTYEDLIKTSDYVKSLRCTGEPDETGKNPYAPIEAVCLKGNGAKMVIPSPYYYVFNSPKEGGLFEQKHMLGNISFFDDSMFNTKYFVVPFNGYEVPTSYPAAATAYLPAWKDMFLASNGMNDEYFDSHIFVVGFFVFENASGGSNEKEAQVSYYYKADWAYVRAGDTFGIDNAADAAGQNNVLQNAQITKIVPVEHAASQEQIELAAKAASLAFGFTASQDLGLKTDGTLAMGLHGTISEKNNHCIFASVSLEDAKVSQIQDSACWVE